MAQNWRVLNQQSATKHLPLYLLGFIPRVKMESHMGGSRVYMWSSSTFTLEKMVPAVIGNKAENKQSREIKNKINEIWE